MKKKTKLFATIASLCLAVALMAFGVYAATAVGFSTTSKVTFTATEIKGYWTMVIAGGDYVGTYKAGNTAKIAQTEATDDYSKGEAKTQIVTLEDIEITPGTTSASVTYTITFFNEGTTDAAGVKVTASQVAAKAGYSVVVDKTGDQACAAAGSVVFVVTLTCDAAADGFDMATASDYTISIAAEAQLAAHS